MHSRQCLRKESINLIPYLGGLTPAPSPENIDDHCYEILTRNKLHRETK